MIGIPIEIKKLLRMKRSKEGLTATERIYLFLKRSNKAYRCFEIAKKLGIPRASAGALLSKLFKAKKIKRVKFKGFHYYYVEKRERRKKR